MPVVALGSVAPMTGDNFSGSGSRRPPGAYTPAAMFSLRIPVGALALALAAGCGGGARQLARPPVYNPPGQSKCSIHKSSDHPLVVEWPSSDRAELEARAKHGLVVVHYSGCEMQLLPQCHVADSSYRYTPTTRKLEKVVITDDDELYANLPVGAAKLEGTLKKAGRLVVAMHVVGRFDAANPGKMKLEGLCQGATHVVTGLTAGAFDFYAGAKGEAGGGIGVAGVGAGAKTAEGRETLNRDGDAAACASSSSSDTAPPEDCGALLRVEVTPLSALDGLERPADSTGIGAEPAMAEVTTRQPLIQPGDGIVRVHMESPDPNVELRGFGVQKLVAAGTGFRSTGASTILCRPPCDTYVDARVGQSLYVAGPDIPDSRAFQLYDRKGDVNLDVRPGNRTLSSLAITGYTVGVLAVIAGASTAVTGLVVHDNANTQKDIDSGRNLEKWGLVTLGGGAVFIGAGVAFDLTGKTKVKLTSPATQTASAR